MTHHSIFQKELLKLYGLSELIQKSFNTIDAEYLDTSGTYILKLFSALNANDVNKLILTLHMMQLKPKIQDDAMVTLILKNVNNINDQVSTDKIKSAVFYTSLNRLINYKLASIQNVLSLNPYELDTSFVEMYNATRDLKIRVAKQLELINDATVKKVLV